MKLSDLPDGLEQCRRIDAGVTGQATHRPFGDKVVFIARCIGVIRSHQRIIIIHRVGELVKGDHLGSAHDQNRPDHLALRPEGGI